MLKKKSNGAGHFKTGARKERLPVRERRKRFEDDLVRVQSQIFENFRKRVTRDKKEVHRYAQDEVFKALLEVADNLERATQIDLEKPLSKSAPWQEKSLRVLI